MSEEVKTNDVTISNVEEKEITKANGGAALFGIIFGQILSIALVIVSGFILDRSIDLPRAVGGIGLFVGIALIVVFSIMYAGLKVVHPNEAAVYTFFGKYYGTIKEAGDGKYYVEIGGIAPQSLNEAITLTVTSGEQSISVTYGPMNYMERMSEKGSENLQLLLKAMYNYYLAAAAYVG